MMTRRNTDIIVEEDSTSPKVSGSARVDFVHKQPKSLSLAISTLGQSKPKQKIDTKLSVSTKISNLGHF